MIELQLVLTGIAIGVAVSAPIGPVNILCIQRSLKLGFTAGLLTGLGSVLGDGMFAAIAAFSVTSISGFLIGYSYWIEIIGGAFLVALGVRSLLIETTLEPGRENLNIIDNTALVGTTFFMTITNPAMVLGFAALFGSAGGFIHFPENYAQATVLVAAVMSGSFLWWLFLAGAMHRYRRKIRSSTIAVINRMSGGLILLFGAAVLVRALIAEYGQP